MSVIVEDTAEGLSSTSNAKEDKATVATTFNLGKKMTYIVDEMFQLWIKHGEKTAVKGFVEENKMLLCYCLFYEKIFY